MPLELIKKPTPLNQIRTWRQSTFVDDPKFDQRGLDWKHTRRREESLKVRSGFTEKAICQTSEPADAAWIAKRLNFASELEQLAVDFATGKNDGQALIDYVRKTMDRNSGN